MDFHRFRVVFLILGSICFGYFGIALPGYSQNISGLPQTGDTLSRLMQEISQAHEDSQRLWYNSIFTNVMHELIQTEEAESHLFEKVRTLNRTSSDDGLVTFFQWNILTNEGKFMYFGFLKVTINDTTQIFSLTDRSDFVSGSDSAILSADYWFGALYYRVITCKDDAGGIFYTLLGWSGKDRQITRKIIDILSFDSMHHPLFGAYRFPDYQTGHFSRIVFRFDASSSMSLKYEDQPLSVARKWDSGKKRFNEQVNSERIIVFDHLVPIDPLLEGQYRYYVPSGEIYSGFILKSGIWHFLQRIDARNSVRKP